MNRTRTILVAWAANLIMAGGLLAGQPQMTPAPAPAHAPLVEPQPYVVLQSNNFGNTYPVSAPGYAYGWFGVCPRARHVFDGTGYYDNYYQSSIRRGY